ncbi:chromodomain-containing protein [Reticulomyxa filosa]|uniref:Chromodomain-containing protein n=1 Tax=Reticulomyxa filosa TaxID=46433 RepID=X6N7J1_RETFI|nr:chromodomain-containing protein [Reticulomyxa filosa]|eukprot:ETO22255.1 chromodomain-containing protein [Reticulomyxa filosa]
MENIETSPSSTSSPLKVGAVISLLWPKDNEWYVGLLIHRFEKSRFAIYFPDDTFTEPLSYDLSKYEYRVLSNLTQEEILQFAEPFRSPKGTKAQGGVDAVGVATSTVEYAVDSVENTNQTSGHTKAPDHALGNEEIKEDTRQEEEDEDEDDEVEPGEVEFEVEAIIDSVNLPTKLYRVEWRNYKLEDCTWEPDTHLDKASQVVEQYVNKLSFVIVTCYSHYSNFK